MTEQLNAGFELLMIGMGIVFLFLAMLIVAVNLMSAIVLHYLPEAQTETASTSHSDDPGVVAAITAAVHQYRSKDISKSRDD